ncbi:MAG: TraB/VirB10 family protein [Syntrophaceae bacterium]
MKKIIEWFNNLSLHQKNKATKLGIIGVCLILIAVMFFSMMAKKGAEQQSQQKRDTGQKEIQIDKNILDKTAYLESSKEIQKIKEDNDQLKKEFELIKNKTNQAPSSTPALQTLAPPPAASQADLVNMQNKGAVSSPAQSRTRVGMPPSQPVQSSPLAGIPPPPLPGEQQNKEIIGGIETVKNTDVKAEDKEVKKKSRAIYIPASTIIPVTLLSGVDATCVEDAKRPNVPVVLRVDNLAFLPNEFKANLKGCRILAQGIGSLADERVHLRSMSLTCISKTGKALIDNDIQGYLADADGKGGVRGNVVSKMDSALWRAFLAGLFGGAGEAIKATSQPTATLNIGNSDTQTLNSKQIRNSALGGGLVAASGELQKFYIELARQLSPTIEVGALRKLAFVTTKGIDLEIKTPNLVR